jgi:hypothetical protein
MLGMLLAALHQTIVTLPPVQDVPDHLQGVLAAQPRATADVIKHAADSVGPIP